VLEGARCIMQDNMRSHGLPAPRAVALLAALVLVFAFSARPAEAKPFAYVATPGNGLGFNGVLVIDTATNMVVATVKVGNGPRGIAVTPDGTHAYVANEFDDAITVIATATNTVLTGPGFPIPVGHFPNTVAITPDGQHVYLTNYGSNSVSVIATASNTVVATVALGLGSGPAGVAITPDGTHAYVANFGAGAVSVIATATNAVLTGTGFPIPVGTDPERIAITPDGQYAYVTNSGSNTVSVIATATNTVLTGTGFPIPVGKFPFGIAITPDGTHAYVVNFDAGTVSVIDTATNTVLTGTGFPIPVGNIPAGVAVTPDGQYAYVANYGSNSVSVIATASNTVVATVTLPSGSGPWVVGIGPPTCIPFLGFSANLEIGLDLKPFTYQFELLSSLTLGSASNGINPDAEAVTIRIGAFSKTIPPGSFKEVAQGIFDFHGVIGGVTLETVIAPTGSMHYALAAASRDANLTGTTNPVPVTLTIGDDCGATSVEALIFH
jgi:YVTN family beta-propeller protein